MNRLVASSASFQRNTASKGGAVYADGQKVPGCKIELTSVNITENWVSGEGGGVLLSNVEVAAVSLVLSFNEAKYGGGAYAMDASNLILTDSCIQGNRAQAAGGGLSAQAHRGSL